MHSSYHYPYNYIGFRVRVQRNEGGIKWKVEGCNLLKIKVKSHLVLGKSILGKELIKFLCCQGL